MIVIGVIIVLKLEPRCDNTETPRGLQQREWLQCLTSYNQRHAGDLE